MLELILVFILFGTISTAMWDEDNRWKRLTILIISVMAFSGVSAIRHNEGYDKGYNEGQCSVYNSLDKQDGVSVENKPEVCK